MSPVFSFRTKRSVVKNLPDYLEPMWEKKFYVYMMANKWNTALYTGFTNDLYVRVKQHKEGKCGAFTSKYKCTKLVYYEEFDYVNDALARENQLKGLSREKKETLVKSMNPEWKDLSERWDQKNK